MDPSSTQTGDDHAAGPNPAADLIRQKVSDLYREEPAAKEELAEAKQVTHRSKHQEFMFQLSTSGRSLAEIQTAWHNYYTGLDNQEKHEVWQEFYQNYDRQQAQAAAAPVQTKPASQPHPIRHQPAHPVRHAATEMPSPSKLKHKIQKHVTSRVSAKHKAHLKSLAFGISCGVIMVVVFLFSFFNERFIAPFITPSRSVSATPIIIDPNSPVTTKEAEIVIPKINVEIPVVYDEPSIDEPAVQAALERGVVHYANTPNPGELGNGVIFGHSSNNIFNKGKFKFAFVLLKRLEKGDTFMLLKNGKRYVYRVFEKKIVDPKDVSVLFDVDGRPATFSLITCDPPGTTLKRLVVIGEQITPDPGKNKASSTSSQRPDPTILPGNAPSLFQRIKDWFSD